jgi:hypothetical protein
MPDQFMHMTKEIMNYVGRTYTKCMADLVQVVEDLTIDNPMAPVDPDPANQLAVEVWKMELKEHCGQTFGQAFTTSCWGSAQRH